MKIIISDYTPPSLNVILRMNYWKRGKLQKQWDRLIFSLVWTAGWRRDKQYSKAKITYQFKNKRRRDKDNYSPKILLDSLKNNGIIKDDNINSISYDYFLEQGNRDATIIELS